MENRYDGIALDSINTMEYDHNGCKVRLHFTLTPNESLQKDVLSNLLHVVERKRQEAADAQEPTSA